MELQALIKQYKTAFLARYGQRLSPVQWQAFKAIQRCRTPAAGQILTRCAACEHSHWQPMSCGNRNCPLCQHHEVGQWLDRQQMKLLPVEYFMATFTLPYELRPLAWQNQEKIYSLMFACVTSTLADFGLNPRYLGAALGMTAVLHTHSRCLAYHPHIHVILPGGGIDKKRRQWRKLKGRYLFNGCALAKVFRARFMAALKDAGFTVPNKLPGKWVANVRHVGKGLPALKYLSRYLYRGVFSEKNIVANQNDQVTFTYIDSTTKQTRYRTLPGDAFLALILQHVLPKGFRRVRDYGFLHANAKKSLALVQLVLHRLINPVMARQRPAFRCPKCQGPMQIVRIQRRPASLALSLSSG